MALLQQSQMLMPFCKWFEIIPHLERVYDLKLSVLACMSLIRLDLDQQTLASISNNLASMLKKLPDAIQTLEREFWRIIRIKLSTRR